MEVKPRDEISDEHKWDLEKVYSSDEEWEDDFARAKEKIEGLKGYEGQVMESPESFAEFIEAYSETSILVRQLYSYASMRRDQDLREEQYQAMAAKANSLSSMLGSATSFVEIEIQNADEDILEKTVELEDREYNHFIEKIREKKEHTRSKEVETVLSGLSEVLDSPSEIYNTFMNADLSFPSASFEDEEIEITLANFPTLLKKDDREFREQVYTKFYDRFSEFENTIAQSLDKEVRGNKKSAEIRDYSSALEASLDQKNVPEEVFNNLTEAVDSNLDALHRHQELKRDVLRIENLQMWDLYTPLADSEVEISYEEAKEHVLEAVKPLGEEYVEAMREGLESGGWVDVYENKGKRSGAYHGGSYGTPPFVLLNFQNDVNSMYTLAHELGHAMHSYFTEDEQPYIYSDYGIFLAEIASTVNEQLLTEHLLENVDDESIKRHALDHQLENFRNTLFRQTMFAEFEKEVHERVENGEVLTAGETSKIYGELKSRFYAEAEVDDRIADEWMRIPHFYYNFYVFQYATGISAAAAIREKILQEGRTDDYLEFLKSGGSQYPLETLQIMGLNMDSETVNSAINQYRDYLKKAEELFDTAK